MLLGTITLRTATILTATYVHPFDLDVRLLNLTVYFVVLRTMLGRLLIFLQRRA